MRLWLVLGACGLAAPHAHAEKFPTRFAEAGDAVAGDLVITRPSDDGPTWARQVIGPGDPSASAESRIIYLNRSGISVVPGDNDARANRSSLVARATMVPGWTASAAVWAQTVGCIDEMFSEFGVNVVEDDPGAVPHIEVAFGGESSDLGRGGEFGGVSPFRADCGVIENSIVFVFPAALSGPQNVCEAAAQEVAHSFGLDHELLAADPMTYLPYSTDRAFQDQLAACGEHTPRPCGLTSTPCWPRQNSVALLRERLGARDPAAPRVTITEPRDGDTVTSQLEVSARVVHAQGDVMATLSVDGVVVDEQHGRGPFVLHASATEGPRTLTVMMNSQGYTAREHVRVFVDEGRDVGCAFGEAPATGCTTGKEVGALLHAIVLWFVTRRSRRR